MSRVPDGIPPGPIKLTYEDYAELPDDGRRYEILDGELEVSPAPSTRHQGVLGNLFWVLHGHVRERGLGSVYCAPIDVILAPSTVVDLCEWTKARGSRRQGLADPQSRAR
jgi:Uma2 family endonuclease